MKNIDSKKTVFIIDGSSFLYRAYYALSQMTDARGLPVQAVYGFCRMIKKLIDDFNPGYLVIAWDSKGKTERHDVFPDYKATRQAPPSDLFDQKELIIKAADLMGIKQISRSGIEADDLMYSMAKELSEQSYNVMLVSSDKDLAQMVDDKIFMYDSFKKVVLDRAALEEKYGFAIERLPFYFSLLGDASDNIPGVRGIGKKGATELAQEFSSLDQVYADIDQVKKPRHKNALLEHKESAFLSLMLFKLRYHALDSKAEDFSFSALQWSHAAPIFAQLGFRSLLRQIGGQQLTFSPDIQTVDQLYTFVTITTREQLKKLCQEITEHGQVAVDTETDGIRPMEVVCVGVSLCYKKGTSYYIPLAHNVDAPQVSRADIDEVLKPVLEDERIGKILHHAKFDQHVLRRLDIDLRGVTFDTLIAASLVVEDGQRKGLKYLSHSLLDEHMLTFDDVVTKQKLQDFSYVGLERATAYAAADAHQTLQIKDPLEESLKAKGLLKLYQSIEHPLVQILFEMEEQGIQLDVDLLGRLGKQVDQDLVSIESEIAQAVGVVPGTINLNSPRQLGQLLFEQLGLPPQKKTTKRTGYSTDQEVLKKLSHMHPVPRLILVYRELYKLKSTYIEALPGRVNSETGRVHTTFSQTSTATGRLASFEPNLQNIPTNSHDYSIRVRSAFQARPGHLFVTADYSQIELRVLAHLSKDEQLVSAFLTGQDVHKKTSAGLFDVAADDVTHEQRQIGKRINFSILYGLTAYGLSNDLGIPVGQAKTYIEKFFAQYTGVQKWMEKVIEKTKELGYTQTLWGRRRTIPQIYEKNQTLYGLGKRLAINTVVQGTSAEIMKIGMINVRDALLKQYPESHILLQIHDELLVSVPEADAQDVQTLIQSKLQSVVDWQIPLLVSTHVGKDWYEVSK